MSVIDALFGSLAGPRTEVDAVDAVNSFVRDRLREPGMFYFACPPIPVGAPWWEIGWEARYVLRSARQRAEDERAVRDRAMTRDRWRRWYAAHRPGSRRHESNRRFDAKLTESIGQLGRLVSLIRGIHRGDGEEA
jgi:hypothetical protein